MQLYFPIEGTKTSERLKFPLNKISGSQKIISSPASAYDGTADVKVAYG